MMRRLRTGSLGLMIAIALACSCKGSDVVPNQNAATKAEFSVSQALLEADAPWAQTAWSAGNSYFSLTSGQDWVFARIWDTTNGGRTFLTADGGTSWTLIGAADSETDLLSVVRLGNDILAGTWNGLYRSTTAGASWNALSPSGLPADTAIGSLATIDGALFAGTIGHIYRSSDNGASFTDVSAGISASAIITSIVASGSALVAGSMDGAFVSSDGGTTWVVRNSGLTDTRIVQLAVLGSKMWAVTLGGVYVSSNNGTSWTADSSSPGMTNCLLVADGQLLAGTENAGLALSSDGGATWASLNVGLPNGTRVWSLAAAGDGVFAATDSGIWRTSSTSTPNDPPTIVAAASASPNPVTGLTTSLAALGADDGGEENLIYTWSTQGTPPAAVTFAPNASNAAKNTTATFSKAGTYTLLVTVADARWRTAQSAVEVTVVSTPTSLVVAPTSATINTSASQQFSATVRDQFGNAVTPQPAFTWTASGGGTVDANGLFVAGTSAGGPFTVTASSGGLSGNASVTVAAVPSTVYQINCGGNAVSPFIADQYVSGGTKATYSSSINTTGVTNPAPQAVYQSERYGNITYTLPNLTVGSAYTVRLHFAELYWTATGKRSFNVTINGTTVLSNYDIYAVTGARYKAVVREFTATPNTSGQIVIAFTTVTDNATIEGIEIIAQTPNYPPSIASVAAASPNPVSGTTSTLSVLGADDAGESNLTYTWATTSTPPAAVTFSANGSNAAKNTTATFSKAGDYTLQVTVRDAPGLTTTSQVAVTVAGTVTSILVAPASASINTLATQQFTATARDQFGTALATQPTFTWSVSGGGTISASGLFTAGTSAGGPYTVTAQSGAVSGAAAVSVVIPNVGPTIAMPAAASPSPVTGSTTALSVLGADDGGEANLSYTWATTGTPPAAVTFSANGNNAAKATTATFSKAGSYTLQVTVKDQGNLTTTSLVDVTVNQTLTSVVVSPSTATVSPSATQQFTATARDQFATNLVPQPSFTWSVSGGGTISASGLLTAGTTAGGPYTVSAQSGGVSGTASVTVAQSIVYQINCGGSAASPYSADQYGSGGTKATYTSTITTTGITNPAPQAVYKSERYGASTYTFPNLTAGASYQVRLHFAELYWTATGKRRFNVAINGTTVLSNYDIYAATGARYKAIVREFSTTANSSGQIVIQFTTVTDNATIEGIQIIRQ